jgi:phospholipase C
MDSSSKLFLLFSLCRDAESMQKGWGPKIMSCFDPSKVPVITTLAQEFVLFDQYFSSVPGWQLDLI